MNQYSTEDDCMTYCGIDCCKTCSNFSECGGCEKCNGHPFGGSCIAERTETTVN